MYIAVSVKVPGNRGQKFVQCFQIKVMLREIEKIRPPTPTRSET